MKQSNFILPVIMITVFLCFSSAFALDPQEKEQKPDSFIPQIERGDNIYFRVSQCQIELPEIGKVDQPILSIFELHGDSHKNLNIASNREFLIRYDSEFEYQIDIQKTKKDKSVRFHRFRAEDLMADLWVSMKKNPTDRSKWTTTIIRGKSRVTLFFVGIQRLYKLDSVEIPKDSPHRSTKIPTLCVCVDRNGVPLVKKNTFTSEGIRSNSPGWLAAFPASINNIWEIREASNDKYLIRLRNVNTTFSEVFLLGVEVDGKDFQDVIYENLGPYGEKPDAVKFRFSLVKD